MTTDSLRLPSGFVLRMRSLLGEEYGLLEAALREGATVSVRMNRDKSDAEPSAERVPWCETGYYLPERGVFTADPLFHAGAYYVQEASSMFLEQVVKAYVKEPATCLDLCAAPGGKSTHLCSLLPAGSLLVGNEVIRSRVHILVENLTKWGNPYVVVTRNDPSEIGRLTHGFDLIVADVPCSGEGMFRKDPGAADRWSVANVHHCAARQRRILQDVWPALKPGGLLVYSACTFETEENEDHLAYLVEELGAEPLAVPLREEWQVTGALKYNYPACRFFPHKTRGEGFFLAVVRKASGEATRRDVLRRETGKEKRLKPPAEAARRLRHPEDFLIERRGDRIEAFPRRYADLYQRLCGALTPVAAGVCLGEVKGNDLLPSHSLAMSRELNRDSFAALALSREEAIQYLKKEALPLAGGRDGSLPAGYALATYRDAPLGFVKLLGNRANNLYPPEWRIRSSRY